MENIIFSLITNGPLIGLAATVNAIISNKSSEYTINDLCEDIMELLNSINWGWVNEIKQWINDM
jgi:hypothetical protein